MSQNRSRIILLLIVLVGIAIRYDFAAPFNFIIDSDEAIVGLMAKHIYEGRPAPVFYYGQAYMGSLEAILAALSFSAFGVSNSALKLVPFAFSIALIPIVYAFTRRCAGTATALVAALLIALPPTPLVVWSSKARGGFIEVIVLGALAFWSAIVWLQRDKPSKSLTIITGGLLGLGWWVNNQIIYFMMPIGLVFFERLITLPRGQKLHGLFIHGTLGILAFMLGGLPFWIYNINHEFITFNMFSGADSKYVAEHLSGLYTTALPIILGGKRFWQDEEFFPGGSQIAMLTYGSVFLTAVLFHARGFFRFITFRGNDRVKPFEIFIVYVIATIAIFSLSSFGYLVQAPRYLLPIYVGLMPLCAYAVVNLGPTIGTTVLTILLSINVGSSYWGEKALPGEPFVAEGERASRDHSELIRWLKEHGYRFVRTNYWIGYRLAFETKEDIRFLMFQDPHQIRIQEYEDLGHETFKTNTPFVLVPSQAKIVRKGLEALGISYNQKLLSGYAVIYNLAVDDLLDASSGKHVHEFNVSGTGTGRHHLTPHAPIQSAEGVRVPQEDQMVTAFPHPERAEFAIDGKMDTRWGSGEHQHPGMSYSIKFKRTVNFRSLRIDLGSWFHDYPRGLQIVIHRANGTVHELIDNNEYQAIRYIFYNEPIELFTDAEEITEIEFRQTGTHPIFDWSIAEIEVTEEKRKGAQAR